MVFVNPVVHTLPVRFLEKEAHETVMEHWGLSYWSHWKVDPHWRYWNHWDLRSISLFYLAVLGWHCKSGHRGTPASGTSMLCGLHYHTILWSPPTTSHLQLCDFQHKWDSHARGNCMRGMEICSKASETPGTGTACKTGVFWVFIRTFFLSHCHLIWDMPFLWDIISTSLSGREFSLLCCFLIIFSIRK